MTFLINEIFLQKIFLSFLIGALLGLEREYTKKQEIAGLRTFSLISLLGCLAVILSAQFRSEFVLVGFAFVCFLVIAFYALAKIKSGFTTHISLVIAYILGVLVGYNLFTEAIFLAILVAIVLFSKERLHKLVKHLTEKEVGDLLEFLILLGIVYPILPQSMEVYGIVIPLMTIWWLIVMITLINFAAFMASRYLHAKYKIELIAFLSGLACSTAATASLVSFYRHNKRCANAISASFILATAGMLIRNFAFIMLAVPQTARILIPPLVFAAGASVLVAMLMLRKEKTKVKIRVDSPFNVAGAAKLGAAILVLFALLNVAKSFGVGYFSLGAFLGGFVDSAGTSISLAGMLLQDIHMLNSVAVAILLASFGSVISNYIICYIHNSKEIIKRSIKPLAAIFALTAAFVYLLVAG